MAIIIVTVLIEGPSLPAELKGSNPPFTLIDSGFFEAVGVISFAYVCHHNTLLIYGSLVTPTIDRWNQVTHISMGISVAASLVMGSSGYLIFVRFLTASQVRSPDIRSISDRQNTRQHIEQLSQRS